MPVLPGGRRPATLTLAALLVLASCAPATPTTAPTPTAGPSSSSAAGAPPAEVYAQIRVQVEAIRGLKPTAAVEPVVIDEATLRKNLEAEFDAENTAAELAIAQDILITLGLLEPGSSLRTITLEFQAAQVAGYYSPDKDQLFVVKRSGALGPAERVTYAHEFTHQLQDQHFDLNALSTDAVDEDDRSLARLALIEGDAVSVQTTWTQANLTPKEIGELLASSLDPKALEALQNAPAFLRDTALFPYQDGVAFVMRLLATGGYAAVDTAFANPPGSAEQVLHPDKYLQREAPLQVALPAGLAGTVGPDWSEAGRDTLGELILRTWLREGGVPLAEARVATAGWGGDRLVLLRGPGGAVTVALRTEWDTVADADEFAAAATKALATRGPEVGLRHRVGSTFVSIAIGAGSAALALALAEASTG
jgi:hypothetical protein